MLASAPGDVLPMARPAQSQTDDPASPQGTRAEAGEWPDLQFANLNERPMDEDSTCRKDLDLIGAGLGIEGEWIYITLRLAAAPVSGSGAHYSVEFDTDLDGRVDVLVTRGPTSEAFWSTGAMRAYLDTDENAGGSRPGLAAAPSAEWDGFVTRREDATTAQPQPLIRIRSSSGGTAGVQTAVARWMLGASDTFAWRAWAEGPGSNPGWQEYKVFQTLEAAGSPYPTSAFYPSKSLVAADNTCVVSFGIVLAGPVPGYCGTRVVSQGTAGLPPDERVNACGGRGVIVVLEGDAAGSAAQGTPASADWSSRTGSSRHPRPEIGALPAASHAGSGPTTHHRPPQPDAWTCRGSPSSTGWQGSVIPPAF